jgi:uncharacterized protein YndB with AHSA1/START domain
MPVKKDPSGQRSVEAEVEVPGTPEEVWAAIATGPGMSSWFVPSTSEERVGGIATSNFGPGMESVATIKTWNPPKSFVAETEEEPGTVATEWTVEARAGGTCVVRVVHRWFASTDNWDEQFEGYTYGWQSFFRILRLYLTHFAGQRCSAFHLAAFSQAPMLETWRSLMQSLGVQKGRQSVVPTQGVPVLSGVVERMGDDAKTAELLLRLDQPADGLAHMFPMPMGGQVLVSIRFYLYGDAGAAIAAEVERNWANWLAQQFPTGASTQLPP